MITLDFLMAILLYNFFYYSNINTLIYTIYSPVFFLENIILQIIILYTVYLLFYTNNTYYILMYTLIIFIFFGIFLCMYQAELYTGFLWVTEFSVIFISIVLLFYLNVNNKLIKYTNNIETFFEKQPYIVFLIFIFNIEFFFFFRE